jgi:Trypsin-co-occurring domain 1
MSVGSTTPSATRPRRRERERDGGVTVGLPSGHRDVPLVASSPQEGDAVSQLIRVPLEGGGSIVVESSDELAGGPVGAGRTGEVVTEAAETLDAALDELRPALAKLLDRLRDVAHPDEVHVELGIKLSAKAGVVIAQTSGEANFTVSLLWRRQ